MEIIKKVGEIDFSERKKVIINILNIERKIRLDIRTYFYNQNNEWIPTKKGVNVPIEKVNDIINLLSKIEIVSK
jgi:hypothetical protein